MGLTTQPTAGFTPAKAIVSHQNSAHDNLEKIVTRHLYNPFKKPIADHNHQAFLQAFEWWQQCGSPKSILDSACGTGESSRYLAQLHSQHLVIGLDRSAKRLSHSDNQRLPENCLLLRCECSDFWRLAEQAQWLFEKHTLYYPNPYPKPQHLKRRWHAHAALPNLLAISQNIELRTNWKIYAEEFYKTLLIAQQKQNTLRTIVLNEYHAQQAITAFERKYQQSQHQLWQVQATEMS